MIDAIKKAILAGVGAAAITTEKAEKALGELVEKGKISASEAKDAATKIAGEGKQEFEAASSKLQVKIDEVLAKAGKGQADRIQSLETQVSGLEERLAKLEESDAPAAKAD